MLRTRLAAALPGQLAALRNLQAGRRLATRALAVAAAVGFAGCSDPEPPPPPSCDIELASAVDEGRAMDHVRHLSVEIGPRVASSPQEREAARYIAAELEGYGYEVEIQEFPREGIVAWAEVLEPAGMTLHVAAGRVRETSASEYPLLTPEGGITGRVVDCGRGGAGGADGVGADGTAPGASCPPEVAGQIALVTPGENGDAEGLVRAAAEAGAVAVILHGEDWRRFVVSVDEAPVPFVTVNLDTAEAMREVMDAPAGGGLEIRIQVNLETTSQNVIATRRVEGDPEAPVVIFTAHYDSVEQSPGASDNGSGAAGLLEFARVLARVPTGFELRFAAVGAEEVGLRGARHYVAELPEGERGRILANFNTDMIGTAGPDQTQLFVNTLDGDNLVARSARAARGQLGLPEEVLRAPFQRGASDHVAFADEGIPAANFIWREPETIALEPWYHHPHDAFENVSAERLGTAMRIVVGAATQVVCADPTAVRAEVERDREDRERAERDEAGEDPGPQ